VLHQISLVLKMYTEFLIFLAWGVILPFGVLWARYAKPLPNAIWFQVHQFLQPIGYAIAIAAFIIAWLMVNGVYFQALAHGVIGVILVALGLIQVLMGIFRPHKEENVEKQRPVRVLFELGHRWNGRAMLLLVIPQIFLGIIAIGTWGTPVIIFYAIYVAVIILMVIVLEIRCVAKGNPMLP